MLDKLPAWARHLIIVLAPGILAFIASTVVPGLTEKGGVYALAASVLTYIVLLVTPVTQQYGVAKTDATPVITAGDAGE